MFDVWQLRQKSNNTFAVIHISSVAPVIVNSNIYLSQDQRAPAPPRPPGSSSWPSSRAREISETLAAISITPMSSTLQINACTFNYPLSFTWLHSKSFAELFIQQPVSLGVLKSEKTEERNAHWKIGSRYQLLLHPFFLIRFTECAH